VVVAWAVVNDFELFSFDIKAAFLHAGLSEDVYIKQIAGYPESDPRIVYKLKRALYGLKQSAYEFYKLFKQHLIAIGLECCHLDRAVFVGVWKKPPHSSVPMPSNGKALILIVPVHVDDGLAATNSSLLYQWFVLELGKYIEVKDLGPVSLHLGVRYIRDREKKKLWMSQKSYVEDLLQRFGMSKCTPSSVPFHRPLNALPPLDPKSLPGVKDEDVKPQFQELVGSFGWLSNTGRPDLAKVTMALSQKCSNPTREDLLVAKGVLRYLSGTRDLALQYPADAAPDSITKDPSLVRMETCGLSDADWASDGSDRKSVSGYAFYYGNCLVSWSASKQRAVALSSTEAEFYALAHSMREAMCLKMFIKSLWIPCPDPFPIFADNESTIALISGETVSSRSKHIDVRYHFIRDQVNNLKTFVLNWVPTQDNTADIFTKPLAATLFAHHRRFLGLVPYPQT
jgi:hypothetical protein